VVAPAGPAAPERVAAVPALLAAQGWQARIYPGCHAQGGDRPGGDGTGNDGPCDGPGDGGTGPGPAVPAFLAAPDDRRLTDLCDALADPAVAAVWCLRGGYGSGRLLEALAAVPVPTQPKLLIGYSDITALQAFLDRLGWPALHAAMPASDLLLPGREADARALFTLLRQGLRRGDLLAPALLPGAWCVPGTASGRLVGGNLSLVAALCGTPWQLRTAGALLFLEEVGEAAYRVDRCLVQLRQAGLLQAAAGFVLGSFTDGDDAAPVLREHLAGLGKPVLAGWPTGHGTPHQPLPLGVAMQLDAGAGTLRLQQDFLVTEAG
jgi:muramoyltetrapeptide carboxypeptidase